MRALVSRQHTRLPQCEQCASRIEADESQASSNQNHASFLQKNISHFEWLYLKLKSGSVTSAPTLETGRWRACDPLHVVGDDRHPIGTQQFIEIPYSLYACFVSPSCYCRLSRFVGRDFDVFDRSAQHSSQDLDLLPHRQQLIASQGVDLTRVTLLRQRDCRNSCNIISIDAGAASRANWIAHDSFSFERREPPQRIGHKV